MRALWVATYPELGASSRYRICQFLPGLERLGVESLFLPLFSNDFFQRFYTRGGKLEKAAVLLASSVRRLKEVVDARRFDVVVVQREAAIVGPPFFEYLAKLAARRPIVFDVDDAIFVNPAETRQASPHKRLARLLKDPKKADRIAAIADEIVVANGYTEAWARRYTDRVSVVPTVVDGEVFKPRADRSNPVPVIGWVGSHSAAPQLESVMPAVERLAKKHKFKLKVVGAGRDFRVPGVEVENLAWKLEREVDDFRGLDIGVCPLFDDPWSKGKPGFKPMIYMACGVPQVSSPIGTVTEFMKDGVSGFFARTEDDWYGALDTLLSSPARRQAMGRAAREAFESGPTLASETPKLHGILARAARG